MVDAFQMAFLFRHIVNNWVQTIMDILFKFTGVGKKTLKKKSANMNAKQMNLSLVILFF